MTDSPKKTLESSAIRDSSSSHWINQVLLKSCEDLSDLPNDVITLTVTSPPYWNAIDYDRHSENPDQWYRSREYAIGYAEYQEYLSWLSGIMKGLLAKTRPGGYCAIVVGTVLLKGRHFPAPFDIAHRLCSEGWDFHQDIIWHKVTGGVKRAGVIIQ